MPKKTRKKRPQYQPTRKQFMNQSGQFQPTRAQFNPKAAAATAVKKMADACSQKLGKLKRELNAAVKEANRAETKAKRCASSLKKTKSRSSAAPKKARKAGKKASRKASSARSVKTVRLSDILSGKASRGNKRWTCGGPVRTGCGGSTSKVLNKVRK